MSGPSVWQRAQFFNGSISSLYPGFRFTSPPFEKNASVTHEIGIMYQDLKTAPGEAVGQVFCADSRASVKQHIGNLPASAILNLALVPWVL